MDGKIENFNKLRTKLLEKRMSEIRHNRTLLITANALDGCFNKYLYDTSICDRCSSKINTYMGNLKTDFTDFLREIKTFFGSEGMFRSGHRFFLDVPPKSFRILEKNKDLLKAYRMIVKMQMEKKNIKKYFGEILLYLNLNVKQRYSSIDLDNAIKSLQDALEGILYNDDKQIKVVIAEKNKVNNSLHEKVIISIKNI